MQPMQSTTTQVLQCGGVMTYQLLCGREIAEQDQMAQQSANYCYLIVNTHDRTAIAVDAAWDVQGLYSLATTLGVKVRGSIYTHSHFDHCGGEVPPFMTQGRKVVKPGAKEVEEQGGRVWAGKMDAQYIKTQCHLKRITPLEDGDVIDCGDLVLHVIHTPGHTPGSICVYASPRCISPRGSMPESPLQEHVTSAENGLLITGDTLFPGSCGRTDIPGANPKHMCVSLSRVCNLDPTVLVLPGHNYAEVPFSTIGSERAENDMVKIGLGQFPDPPPLPVCMMCDNCACGPKGFIIGRKVRIKGLTSDTGRALNGQPAVVQSFTTEKERYSVRLFSAAEVKSLKPDNLDVIGPGEQCDAPEPPEEEEPPPPTPRTFVDAALALIDNATPADRKEYCEMQGPFDWGAMDPRWFLLKNKLLNGGSMRATFGESLFEVLRLLRKEFDPKWQNMIDFG